MALGATPRKHPFAGLPTGNEIGSGGHHRWTRRCARTDTYDEQSALRCDAHRSVLRFSRCWLCCSLSRCPRVFSQRVEPCVSTPWLRCEQSSNRYTPWNIDATIGMQYKSPIAMTCCRKSASTRKFGSSSGCHWRQQANARFQLRLTPFFAGSGRMVTNPSVTGRSIAATHEVWDRLARICASDLIRLNQ